MSIEHSDILIVGAGVSGIGMACHIRRELPHKRILILERRRHLGGTWDLFRYPGIRSDSDMFSFGYDFRPWKDLRSVADGASIRNYLEDTAREHGVDSMIRHGLKILRADWSSIERRWTLHAIDESSGDARTFSCDFMVSCTGYYNHDAGHRPHFPGEESFGGRLIHPQQWPEDFDPGGKKMIVIGSGATAVTLVPALTAKGAQVSMLQRSPSYIFSIPGTDKSAARLLKLFPEHSVFSFARRRSILISRLLYAACRRWPDTMRKLLLKQTRKRLGEDFDMRHFTPRYMPWDQRLCVVPDGDLFKALRSGKATMVTDEIKTFTPQGVLLESGLELQADAIVTATGLEMQSLGGMTLSVDGKPLSLHSTMTYKSLLLERVPNMAWVFGYTNAAWTLKVDICGRYLCRLLQHMDAHRLAVVTPHDASGSKTGSDVMESIHSGYVERARHLLPRQGSRSPWKVTMNYPSDRRMLLEEAIDDGVLRFEAADAPAATDQDEKRKFITSPSLTT